MGGLSIWHWLIVIVVVLLIFGGRGKVSSLMGDLGKGIKSFKQSMAEEDKAGAQDAKMSESGALSPPLPEQKLPEQTTTKTTSNQG